MSDIQHCFICRPLDSTVSEDTPTTRPDLIHGIFSIWHPLFIFFICFAEPKLFIPEVRFQLFGESPCDPDLDPDHRPYLEQLKKNNCLYNILHF
jgi:hypothetical protein